MHQENPLFDSENPLSTTLQHVQEMKAIFRGAVFFHYAITTNNVVFGSLYDTEQLAMVEKLRQMSSILKAKKPANMTQQQMSIARVKTLSKISVIPINEIAVNQKYSDTNGISFVHGVDDGTHGSVRKNVDPILPHPRFLRK